MSRVARIIVESNSSNARKLDLSKRIAFSRDSIFIKESDFVEENVLIGQYCFEQKTIESTESIEPTEKIINLIRENNLNLNLIRREFCYNEPPYIAILVSIDGKNHTGMIIEPYVYPELIARGIILNMFCNFSNDSIIHEYADKYIIDYIKRLNYGETVIINKKQYRFQHIRRKIRDIFDCIIPISDIIMEHI